MSEFEEKEVPGYMTYREAAIMFSLMPDNEAAKAIKATVNYYLYRRVTQLEGVAGEVFSIMMADIDRNNIKYQSICKRNQANGSKGGRPKKTQS